MEVIDYYSGHALQLIFAIPQNSSKSQKMVKKRQKTHQKSHILTPNPQYDFGHYFFQYFSLAEPSKWLLVNEKMTLKIFKIFQKIDEIFRIFFFKPLLWVIKGFQNPVEWLWFVVLQTIGDINSLLLLCLKRK